MIIKYNDFIGSELIEKEYKEFTFNCAGIILNNKLAEEYCINSIFNFNIKERILDYYEKNIHLIMSNSLKTQIQNFINFISNVNMDLDWGNTQNESGVDKNAIELFKKLLLFGNEFNKTTIPKELNYLNEFL